MTPAETRRRKRLTREEQKAQTRERLLEAGERVFLRRGFERASTEEISAEAGYTRGAFYSNFEGKEELFFELITDRLYKRYTRLIETNPTDLSPREKLRWAGEQIVELFGAAEEEGGRLPLAGLWLECMALAARNERFRDLAANFWRANRETMAAEFRQTYEERGIEPPIDPLHIATAMAAFEIGFHLQRQVDPEQVPFGALPPLFELLFANLVDPKKTRRAAPARRPAK